MNNRHYSNRGFNLDDLLLTNIDGTEYIMLGILVIPVLIFILYHIIEWDTLIDDIKTKYNHLILGVEYITPINVPIGVKYILSELNIKDVESLYRITSKRRRKINTYFSYLIYTKNDNGFHLYFNDEKNETKWYIYKKHDFNNKPIRIKGNYYKIMKVINHNTYIKIKYKFNQILREQKFVKT